MTLIVKMSSKEIEVSVKNCRQPLLDLIICPRINNIGREYTGPILNKRMEAKLCAFYNTDFSTYI